MECLFSIVFVFKLSICVVALSSLYSKLRFSPVVPITQIIEGALLATKCQSMKEQYWFYVCLLVKNKLNETKNNSFLDLAVCFCFNKQTSSSVQYFASVTRKKSGLTNQLYN